MNKQEIIRKATILGNRIRKVRRSRKGMNEEARALHLNLYNDYEAVRNLKQVRSFLDNDHLDLAEIHLKVAFRWMNAD